MTNKNNQSNRLIKLCIIAGDFLILSVMIFVVLDLPAFNRLTEEMEAIFWMVSLVSMLISQWKFSSTIHERKVGANAILRETTLLVVTQTLLSYLILRSIRYETRVGIHLLTVGVALLFVLILVRLTERILLKYVRSLGYNTRTATFVGTDKELGQLHNRLMGSPTYGYKVLGCYGEIEGITCNGTVEDFIRGLDNPESLKLGDELYLCVSRNERDIIKRTVNLCNNHVVKFYYVPVSSELLNLQPVMIDDLEMFTTYTSPLEDSLNRTIKRAADFLLSAFFLLLSSLLLPFVVVMIKLQSPGPIFFRQRRTGLDGRDFWMYKFRSMHVNADADRLQASEDDPRKFPFGNFMRRTNIDELPQFWNVLCGDMSIVGPRPHMLAHTKQYSNLIDRYMVRHFVRPGVTGWAQVTGFRGETRELWQMEGRVERDIWYIQHWSVWLDIRIIWMTFKSFFYHDKNAY